MEKQFADGKTIRLWKHNYYYYCFYFRQHQCDKPNKKTSLANYHLMTIKDQEISEWNFHGQGASCKSVALLWQKTLQWNRNHRIHATDEYFASVENQKYDGLRCLKLRCI